MSKDIKDLLPDIKDMLQSCLDGDAEGLPDDVKERFGERVAHHVGRALSSREDKERPPKTLYMSEVGKPCRRQLWYSLNHRDYGIEKEPLLPHNITKFLYGDMLEELVLLFADASGHEVKDCQAVTELELVDGWKVRGRIDAVVDGHLVDVKSASSYSFKKFSDGTVFTDDPFGYITQLSGYAKALGHSSASFLVIDKTTGNMCRLELTQGDMTDFTEEWKKDLVKDVSAMEPPSRGFSAVPEGKSGNMKLPVNCSYCPFKFECWKDSNNGQGLRGFAYSRGPVYLTEVKREPNKGVPEIK